MDECSRMTGCDFYQGKLDIMPTTAELIKKMYCHKDSEACAKYFDLAHEESIDGLEDLMPQDSDFS